VVTAGQIYASEDEEWAELTPLGSSSTSEQASGAEDGRGTLGDVCGRFARSQPPAPFTDGLGEPRARARPPTMRRRSDQPALRGRVQALLTDKLVAEERECDELLARLRVRGMSRSVVLGVCSIKGGIGKTTIARCLADAFQGGLRQNTLLVDLDLEWGTAVATAPPEAQRELSILDVYRQREEIRGVGDLLPCLVPFGSGALLLRAPTEPREVDAVTPEVLASALAVARRFFQVVLLDLPPGAGIKHETCRWAYDAVDEALVLTTPTKATVDYQLRQILQFLGESYPALPVHVALNLVPGRPGRGVREVLATADSILGSRRVLRVHRDDRLARQIDAASLEIGQLGVRTRVDIKRLAASLAEGWCR
jgi:MinD-like ATPase involved in chromosome partitioning or flagellar assembly